MPAIGLPGSGWTSPTHPPTECQSDTFLIPTPSPYHPAAHSTPHLHQDAQVVGGRRCVGVIGT
eukprot:123559-Chlamydomonas_euryale.AAC.1